MKKTLTALAATLALGVCVQSTSAVAQTAATSSSSSSAAVPSATGYSVETTLIGDLLDDPAARAVVDKYIPGFSQNPQVDMARAMTLRDCQQYAPDTMTDDLLKKIDTDLKALPKKKA